VSDRLLTAALRGTFVAFVCVAVAVYTLPILVPDWLRPPRERRT